MKTFKRIYIKKNHKREFLIFFKESFKEAQSMGREIWFVGIEEGETKTGIEKNTCFSLWANTSLIKIGNTGIDSGVQVKTELFGKTNMERGLWFKYRTEKDGECFQPSRNVTGLLQMPRDLVLTPLVGSYSLNSLYLSPQIWLLII